MSISLILNKSPRFLLYALFLLMPVFFVPGLSLPIDLHKQLVLAVIVFTVGILWAIDVLKRGEVSFRWHILFVPLGLFVLFALISAFGSGAFLHSFFGANAEPDSFFNILLFAFLFVLVVNKLAKREYVLRAVGLFVAGAALSALLLFASSLFSLTFPFGSAFAFSIYAGGAFVVALLFALNAIKGTYGAYLTYAAAAILFLAVLFTSQWVAWAGIAVSSLVILYSSVRHQRESDINQRKSVAIPLIIFALSLIFLFVSNPLSNVLSIAPEVRLGGSATIDIAKDTVSSSVKNALFGSGPTTFLNQYKLHRGAEINNTPFWNLRFENGTGAVASFFTTVGVLGGGAILIFGLWFLWFCVRFLMTLKNAELKTPNHAETETESFSEVQRIVQRNSATIPVLMGGIYFLISWLLYTTNFALLFAGFAFVALWAALRGRQEKIVFSQSSALMFWGMAGSVAVLVAFVFGGYTVFRNYSAEISYLRGAKYIEEKNYPLAIDAFQKSARIVEFDKHFRKLSQAIFLQTSNVYRDQSVPAEEKSEVVQRGITASENAAILATQANPRNSTNFEQLGDFYRNVIPVSDSAVTMPFAAYNKASELDPQSPYIPLKKAKAHFANAKRFVAKDTDRAREAYAKAIEEARKEAEKALALKGDFVDAREFLSSLPIAAD